jgi:hypothetical protein
VSAFELVSKLLAAEEAGRHKKAEIYHLALLGLTGIVKRRYSIALDFDGTLCDNAWPNIGAAHSLTIVKAQRLKLDYGVRFILNTCRSGLPMDNAITWCKAHGLPCDAYNENLPDAIEAFGGDCRKICADEYWDDKGVCVK